MDEARSSASSNSVNNLRMPLAQRLVFRCAASTCLCHGYWSVIVHRLTVCSAELNSFNKWERKATQKRTKLQPHCCNIYTWYDYTSPSGCVEQGGSRMLRMWVWILLGAWMSVCCECCVLSVRGLCGAMITRPEESYWAIEPPKKKLETD